MSEAQIGLLTATPLIVRFAGSLRVMGVLSTAATASAVVLSLAVTVLLFSTIPSIFSRKQPHPRWLILSGQLHA